MTNEDFNALLEDMIAKIRSTLGHKAVEYARGNDRLSNFKLAAALNQSTPEKALLGMLTKHVISVWDFVRDIDEGVVASEALWDEKLGDVINYCILLKGLIAERLNAKSKCLSQCLKGIN
jgi:hypothetical protein